MTTPTIKLIVIHCAASKNGRSLATPHESAAQVIDRWHKEAGFHRTAANVAECNRHLKYIGYQYVIDTTGRVETGRRVGETGAHVRGHNTGSVGICLVGTNAFTVAQWDAMRVLVNELRERFPLARICGHRDLSPDKNGDGVIMPDEWIKICPGFTVANWLNRGERPLSGHITE